MTIAEQIRKAAIYGAPLGNVEWAIVGYAFLGFGEYREYDEAAPTVYRTYYLFVACALEG